MNSRMSLRRHLVATVLFCMLVACGCGQSVIGVPDSDGNKNANGGGKSRLPVTVSKETTWITEPLRADGYPDYQAALNQRASRGITPENNTVVALMHAFGPEIIDAKDREQFFKMLGISPLLKKGDYFVDYDEYLKKHNPETLKRQRDDSSCDSPLAYRQERRSRNRPWIANDCPLVAAWLAANEKPLAQVIEASRRSQLYVPVISPGTWEIEKGTGRAFTGATRAVVKALCKRAMLRGGEGEVELAWSDLHACHRLGRHLRWVATSECPMQTYIEGVVCFYCWQFAHFSRITPEQARKYRDDLRNLPPLPPGFPNLITDGRCEYLDAICAGARDRAEIANIFGEHGVVIKLNFPKDLLEGSPDVGISRKDTPNTAAAKLVASGLVDWDQVLRMGNEHYNQIAEAGRLPTWPQQRDALDVLKKDIKRQATNLSNLPEGAGKDAQKANITRRMSAICLESFLYRCDIPQALLITDKTAIVKFQLTDIALALSVYRAVHGEYPEKLNNLAPKYLDRVPYDPWGNGPFHYDREKDGYVLYSVGVNGKDDNGPLRAHGPITDDIGIRIPGQKEEDE